MWCDRTSLMPNCTSAPIQHSRPHWLALPALRQQAPWTQTADTSVAGAVACQPDTGSCIPAAACSLFSGHHCWINPAAPKGAMHLCLSARRWQWDSGDAENFRCSRHRTTVGRRESLVSCRFNLAFCADLMHAFVVVFAPCHKTCGLQQDLCG